MKYNRRRYRKPKRQPPPDMPPLPCFPQPEWVERVRKQKHAEALLNELLEYPERLGNTLVEIDEAKVWENFVSPDFKELLRRHFPYFRDSALIRIKNDFKLHQKLTSDIKFGAIHKLVYRELRKVKQEDRQKVWDYAKTLQINISLLSPKDIKLAIEKSGAQLKPTIDE